MSTQEAIFVYLYPRLPVGGQVPIDEKYIPLGVPCVSVVKSEPSQLFAGAMGCDSITRIRFHFPWR